ncbi:MAG: hypothetical protein FWD39_03575 [Clostridiales bacterium]|nr:hypothetical protein [Clostridiales bacterium]
MATNNKNTALTEQKNNSGFLALADAAFSESLSQELEGLDLSFEKIKIPSAGSTVFEVPGEEDDTDTVKEFSAVILHHHTLNAYYKTKYTGGNNPPDCGSFDGVTGEGDPGGNCKSCPLNQFGTADEGAGKACKNRRRIYVLREGEVFPLLLSLPTGSLKEFTKYIKKLLGKGKKSNMVVTRFSLKKATSSGGVVYSQAQFAIDRVLIPQEQVLIDNLTEQVKAYSRQVAFDAETSIDITVDEETGEVIEPLA